MRPVVFGRYLIAALLAVALVVAGTNAFAETKETPKPGVLLRVTDLDLKNISTAENIVGNLFADAAREAVKADVALIASSEIRTKLTEDVLTVGELSSLVNYPEDTVNALLITGKQILDALEQSVASYPKPTLRFLHVSGISFEFDPAKPQGSRVQNVLVDTGKDDKKEALSAQKVYGVAVSRSLAKGALGYWKIWDQKSIKGDKNPPTLIDAIDKFVKENTLQTEMKPERIKPLAKG